MPAASPGSVPFTCVFPPWPGGPGARHGQKGGARIDAQGGIQSFFLGALQSCLGALDIDFLGTLGAIGEHANMIVQHLQEAAVDGEIALLAVRRGHVRQGTDAEQPEQRGVAGQIPMYPFLPGTCTSLTSSRTSSRSGVATSSSRLSAMRYAFLTGSAFSSTSSMVPCM